jgi:hypothetical protein
MATPKKTRKTAPKPVAKRARAVVSLAEKETFEQDDETTAPGKNKVLADLLNTAWLGLAIVRIDRIEIGSQRGWRATFRD